MMRIDPTRVIVALLLAAVAVMLSSPDAFAFADDVTVGSFSCSGGIATDQLLISGASCPTSLTMNNIFSFLVCNMEQLASNVMGNMYCGMVQELAPSVIAAVSLAVAIFGITFTIGLTPATGQEAILFLIKISFVILFATNADYLISIAYRFLIGAISDGSGIVISLMTGNGVTTGADVYAELDKFLSTFVHYATDMVGEKKDGTGDPCKNALFAVLGTMFVIFPLMAYVGLMLVARIVFTFFRAVFAYIYAVVGITFLMLLAPFFVTFYLFKQTRTLFDKWIAYLASFTLQVILLFAFLAFIFSMNLKDNNVVKNLTNIIMYQSEQAETTTFRLPFQYCTLCDFHVVDKDNPSTEIKEGYVDPSDPSKTYITQGMLQCTTPKKPIRPTFATSPDDKGQVNNLLKFMSNGILALIVLALLIEHLLKLIPSLAQKLASGLGATYSTQLGGGFNPQGVPTANMPFQSLMNDATAGFNSGFGGRQAGNNSATAAKQGIMDGLSALVTGRTASGGELIAYTKDGEPMYNSRTQMEAQTDGRTGIGGMWSRWMSDPTKFGQ